MLKNILGNKEEKTAKLIEHHISEGLSQLNKKMYNAAMIDFAKAIELDSKIVLPRLLKELEKVAASGDFEAALSLGLNLLKERKNDFELANKLGNYARQLGDFKQAASLYKTAHKINKNFKVAFYNLAACDVKVPLYDEQIVNSISQFKSIKGNILPSYIGGDGFVENFTQRASALNEKMRQQALKKLTLKHQQATQDKKLVEAQELEMRIKALGKDPDEISPDFICQVMQKTLSDQTSDNERYNYALYALNHQKPALAEEAIGKLRRENFPLLDVLNAILLGQKGMLKESEAKLVQLLGENEFNRYYNVNLGLLYRKIGKQFLSIKYLVKTADLLAKSGGVFSMQELLVKADANYNEGKEKEALKFYKLAVTEIADPEIWNKIGMIYKKNKAIEEAIAAFKEILKLDPKSEIGKSQLKQIHDVYVKQGDELMEEKKFSPASDYYRRALGILRLPESIRKAAQAHHMLNDIKEEKKLLKELESLESALKDEENEKLRQALLIKSRQLMAKKQYQKATEMLEAAFEMKIDKKVYAQLAALYKPFKGKDSLVGLAKRWEDMLIQEERRKMMEKEQERDGDSEEE